MSSSPSSNVPRHATHRYYTTIIAVGLALLAIGLFGIPSMLDAESALGVTLPLTALVIGVMLSALGFVGRKSGAGVQLVNSSFDLIARGRLADAEKVLDETDKTNTTPLIKCVAIIQRGLIAMRRGDAKTGLGHLDRAIEMKAGIIYRQSVRVQTVNALGIRAFLRAVTGDREGARVDAKALRESPYALPQALARAALAEAICIEREGDRDALRKHLAEHRDLLFDVTDRRERAIVRAFQRLLETTATSVYRKVAKLDLHGDDPPLVDWVAQLVPAAAPFVEAPTSKASTNDLPVAVASEDAKKAVTNARKSAEKQSEKGPSRSKRVLVMWTLLLGVCFGLWKVLMPDEGSGGGADFDNDDRWDWDSIMLRLAAIYVVVFAALAARRIAATIRAKRQTRELYAALNLSAQGKLDDAHKALTELSASRFAFVKSQAHLALAHIAERRADLPTALDHCDKGLACLSRYVLRISASDILLPDLMSQRAFVLAAMDRHDEAEAELASLPPAYPFRSRALLRVRLVSLVRRGDLDAAAKLASETNLDLPLTARDELLADGLCAAVKPESVGAGEVPRIRRELRTVAALRPWLATVAPAALDAIERITDETAAARNDVTDDQTAETEAQAEAEAAREEASLRRAAQTV